MAKILRSIVIFISLFVILGAASCSRGGETIIGDVAIATGVNVQNAPENDLTEVNASSEAIYLSARVDHPSSTTQVQVRWYQLSGQLIAKESFSGRRSSTHLFDFDKGASSSFLASRIEREGISWPTGEYRAEVFLGDQLVKTVFFKIISDAEASQQAVANKVQQIRLGDTLNSQFKVDKDVAIFTRATNDIYIQISLIDIGPNTEVKTNVRYIKEDQQVANFTSEVTGDKELVLNLSRERFGRFWPDRLWPEGAFEVGVIIGGVQARTRTFQVK